LGQLVNFVYDGAINIIYTYTLMKINVI
jgi:hypothetical protein